MKLHQVVLVWAVSELKNIIEADSCTCWKEHFSVCSFVCA